MTEVFIGITATAQNSLEGNKQLKIITPNGIKNAIIKGVLKPNAKLKPATQPFAFYQFSGAKKGNFYVITGASQMEDLFGVCSNCEKFCASSIILECALFSFLEESEQLFIYLLHRIKDIIYSDCNPYLSSIRFIQYLIHNLGYGYDYPPFLGEPKTSMQLLSLLSKLEDNATFNTNIDKNLIINTLNKLILNFENKFECNLKSKSSII